MQKFKSEEGFDRASPVHFRTTTNDLFHQGLVDGEIVQISPGAGKDELSVLLSPTMCLAHQEYPHSATVRTTQPPDNANFTLPLDTGADWRVNGRPGTRHVLFLNSGMTETQIIAPYRNSVFVRVSEDRLQISLDTLSGGVAGRVRRMSGPIELSASSHAALSAALLGIIRPTSSRVFNQNQGHDPCLEDRVADLLAQAILSTDEKASQHPGSRHDPYRLFSRVMSHLEQEGGRPACLGELCIAAGVSAPTLTRAFREVVGVSPMKYERLRRLASAQSDLLRDPDPRSVVKRTALRHGFRELGRFSALYKASYGVLPSDARKHSC